MPSWPDVERRDPGNRDSGERRRYHDVREALERIEDVENRLVIIDGREGLLHTVGELAGQMKVVLAYCFPGGGAPAKTPTATGWRLGLQFAGAVVVPVLIAVIGGYFVLKAAGINASSNHPPPTLPQTLTTPGAIP